jgi:hypothetical protein
MFLNTVAPKSHVKKETFIRTVACLTWLMRPQSYGRLVGFSLFPLPATPADLSRGGGALSLMSFFYICHVSWISGGGRIKENHLSFHFPFPVDFRKKIIFRYIFSLTAQKTATPI